MLARQKTYFAAWLFLAALLGACGAAEPELSAASGQAQAQTELRRLRATATVRRARLQTTLDYVGTRVGQAATAEVFLKSQLRERGFEAEAIDTSISQIRAPAAIAAAPAATAVSNQGAQGLITPLAPPTPVPIASPTPRASVASADSSAPRLEALRMAVGVDGQGCARGQEPRFTPNSREIYVVARAYNIAAGAVISSRWQYSGSQVAQLEWRPERDYSDECIWFYINQSDAPFQLGAWSVEIRVDDVALAPPLAFEIVAG